MSNPKWDESWGFMRIDLRPGLAQRPDFGQICTTCSATITGSSDTEQTTQERHKALDEGFFFFSDTFILCWRIFRIFTRQHHKPTTSLITRDQSWQEAESSGFLSHWGTLSLRWVHRRWQFYLQVSTESQWTYPLFHEYLIQVIAVIIPCFLNKGG